MSRTIKNPRRPATDASGKAIRKIPRSEFGTSPVDAFIRWLYRYNFHILCTDFKVYQGKEKLLHVKASDKDASSPILDIVNCLYENSKEVPYSELSEVYGLAIKDEGVETLHDIKDFSNHKFKAVFHLEEEIRIPKKIDNSVTQVSSNTV